MATSRSLRYCARNETFSVPFPRLLRLTVIHTSSIPCRKFGYPHSNKGMVASKTALYSHERVGLCVTSVHARQFPVL